MYLNNTEFKETGDLTAGVTFTFTVTNKMGRNALKNVFFNFSGGGITGNIVISLDSAYGAAYDTVLKTIVMNGSNDAVYAPEGEITFQKGDILSITIPATAVTYGLFGNFRGV